MGLMKMFFRFPREIGFPKRYLVKSLDEFKKLIAENIAKLDIYTTVYSFEKLDGNKPDYGSAVIDKIFFDFDEDDSFDNVKELHKKLKNLDLLHTIFFSGGGFHVYVFVKLDNSLPSDKKSLAITKIAKLLAKGYDEVCTGDLARLTRLPNTFNFKRKRFCVPVSEEDLNLGLDFIKAKAKAQQPSFYFYGNKILNLNNLANSYNSEEQKISSLNSSQTIHNINIFELPPFLAKILEEHKKCWVKATGWRDRYLIILWLRELGFNKLDVKNFLAKNLTPDEYNHAIFEEKQVDYIFSEARQIGEKAYIFPSPEVLASWGYNLTQKDIAMVNSFYLRVKNLKRVCYE
jgi:hypothetical protein